MTAGPTWWVWDRDTDEVRPATDGEVRSGRVMGYDRSVARDDVPGGYVSTVFLALDHNFYGTGDPVLWETLVFGGPAAGEMRRYTTKPQALAGHTEVVSSLRAADAAGEAS